jgi:hypothetical protein
MANRLLALISLNVPGGSAASQSFALPLFFVFTISI